MMNYRNLELGEIIIPGDEWYDDDSGLWFPTTRASWGATLDDEHFKVRREIPQTQAQITADD